MSAAKRAPLGPRPAMPAPTARPKLKRLNVDLTEGDHLALRLWAATDAVDASSIVRALLHLADEQPGLRAEVVTLARRLADERKAAR
jgi:hypothetical protein